jgi:hypothetical protein
MFLQHRTFRTYDAQAPGVYLLQGGNGLRDDGVAKTAAFAIDGYILEWQHVNRDAATCISARPGWHRRLRLVAFPRDLTLPPVDLGTQRENTTQAFMEMTMNWKALPLLPKLDRTNFPAQIAGDFFPRIKPIRARTESGGWGRVQECWPKVLDHMKLAKA